MKPFRFAMPGILFCIASITFISAVFSDDPTKAAVNDAPSTQASGDDTLRIPVETARDRARLMHEIYSATLDVMHRRYFHGDRAVVPARAMEDVFAEIKRQSDIKARWISVNMKAMSIDHEPDGEFEKRAAKEIAGGKQDVETIEDGYFRRATAIRLKSGCITCHGGFFQGQEKTPKFAALLISVPVNSETGKTD